MKRPLSTRETDFYEGKWKKMRGRVKQRWRELTDDDLKRIDGVIERRLGAG